MVLQPQMVLRAEQRLVMTAMLQQAIGLLPMTRLELQQAVQQELLENPVLEENLDEVKEVADGEMPEVRDDLPNTETDERGEVEIEWENIVQDSYGLDNFAAPSGDEDFPSYEQTLSHPESLHEHLEWQLNLSLASERVVRLAQEIIWNIDEAGFLRVDTADIVSRDGFTPSEAAEALRLVQSFDPPGVGARDLKECLLLQLNMLEFPGEEHQNLLPLAKLLVTEQIEHLIERNFSRLARTYKVSVEEIRSAVEMIRCLDPQPGARFSQERVEVAEPDVTVTKRGDDFEVTLNDDGLPPLRISPTYKAMAANRGGVPTDTRRYIEERVRAAVWFVKSVEQRRETIMKVSRSIVMFQRDFLENGVSHLRPLVLRDVAEDIEMHESTVSRVTTGKYMETPQGVYSFKYFFHSGLVSIGGGNTSSVAVKEKIRQLVETENKQKPLTDQQLVEKLRESDVVIARRTVTKYRKELRLPAASRRRTYH
ncbi:RNA polymerase factor sigma-54 [Nitrospinota bacterium]